MRNRERHQIDFQGTRPKVRFVIGAALIFAAFTLPGASPAADRTGEQVIVVSDGWIPLPEAKDILRGSALDLSFLLDPPAGKYGRLTVDGGNFVFEKSPRKPCRFAGLNVCFWNGTVFTREESDRVADRIAACGFNLVRLHAFDKALAARGGTNTTDLDPEQLDRFDYLLHVLKKRGIYVTIDLFINRAMKEGELPGVSRPGRWDVMKAAIPVMDAAMENWKIFSSNLLNHVNPYEGVAWKDEPAVITVSLVNEGTVFDVWDNVPDIKAIYDAKFKEWLAKHKTGVLSPGEEAKYRAEFLSEVYLAAFTKMKQFLRELGVKAPLTDQNRTHTVPVTVLRDRYDYVDTHFYYDYPIRKENKELFLTDESVTRTLEWEQARAFPTRLLDKPFSISEFNWCFPNRYRAEAGPVTAAYAALQDWNLLCVYDYGENVEDQVNEAPVSTLAIANDPGATFSFRAMSLLFLRGDVESSGLCFPIYLNREFRAADDPVTDYPLPLPRRLGLVGKVGTVLIDPKALSPNEISRPHLSLTGEAGNPNAVDLLDGSSREAQLREIRKRFDFGKGELDLRRGFARSSTGEIEMDAQGETFLVSTPKSEALVLCRSGKLGGRVLSVEQPGEAATYLVTALDGKRLEESNRLLLCHLTSVMNSGVRFREDKGIYIQSAGQLPVLLRRGRADVHLKGEGAATVYALDLTGRRIGEVKAKNIGGTVSFRADSLESGQPCLAYEIVR